MIEPHPLESAHKYCLCNGKMLKEEQVCGCFHCQKIFLSSELKAEDFIPEEDGNDTACCPYCGIDSVIGEKSGYPITAEWLAEMNRYWFY